MTINPTDLSASSADSITQTASTDTDVSTSVSQDTSATQDAKQISADPSAAGDQSETKADEAQSLLDVVKNVVKEEAKSADGTSLDPNKTEDTSKATETLASDAQAVKDDGKPTDAEVDDAKLPFHKHPRFQQVIKERSAYRQEADTLKPDAEEWRAVRTFMDTNSLTPHEVAEGFQIMAAMKSDPIRAREMLSSYWNSLETFAGNKLPEDLKTKVDEGEVDEALAAELARRRNEADFLRRQQEATIQAQAQQAEFHQQAAVQGIMRNAVTEWENGIKTRDADYTVKAPFLMDKVKAAMAARPPQTPDEAIALVEAAYKDVGDSLRRFTPQRAQATTIKSETSSANVKPEPRSLRDAVRLAAVGQL
jgi:hypothetical protein